MGGGNIHLMTTIFIYCLFVCLLSCFLDHAPRANCCQKIAVVDTAQCMCSRTHTDANAALALWRKVSRNTLHRREPARPREDIHAHCDGHGCCACDDHVASAHAKAVR